MRQLADPLVSIIITCHNNSNFIEECITSALEQSEKRVEVIVVNDKSTDNSSSKIDRLKRHIRLIENIKRGGACIARNTGLSYARGQYIKFLDGDDALFPNCIQDQLAQISELPPTAIPVGYHVEVDKDGKRIGYKYPRHGVPAGVTISLSWLYCFGPLTSSPLHRRDALISSGGFNERIQRGQEHELHMRLAFMGIKFIFFKTRCYKFREYNNSARISRSNALLYKDDAEALVDLVEFWARHNNARMPDDLAELLARDVWRAGRNLARKRMPAQAKASFALAQSLYGHCLQESPKLYWPLMRILGPVTLERILASIRGTSH